MDKADAHGSDGPVLGDVEGSSSTARVPDLSDIRGANTIQNSVPPDPDPER